MKKIISVTVIMCAIVALSLTGCFGNFAMWASQDFIDSMRSDD